MNQIVLPKTTLSAVILAAILWFNACNACTSVSLPGTYTDSTGGFKLELKSGGTASLTTLNNTTACTYKVDGKQLTVQCENQILPFTIQNDGSLMPPAEAQLGPLKKTKP
jgi:hypothetical protein